MSQQPMMPGPGGPPPAGPAGEPPRTPSRAKPVVVIGAVVVLVALGAGYLIMRMRQQEPPPSQPPPPVAAQVDAGTPAPLEPPSVQEGDALVRKLAGPLSPDPELAKWLGVEGLLQRFTTAVANIADGESPRMVLAFMAPAGGFQVATAGGKTTIDPKSYERYDPVARVFDTMDVDGAAVQAWLELKPLVDRVYVEIAPPGRTFEQTLNQAIQHLLEVPVPEADVEVVPKGALYAYADPKLEGLSKAQKHLVRMGPRNMQIIQTRLKRLHTTLRLPAIDR
jgi:hypothetical protein